MWAAQHATVPPRTSAKNLDLSSISLESHTKELPSINSMSNNPTEMWLGKHQRSLPSGSDHYQYSVPSLSPRSSNARLHENDETSSQASESTAFSTTDLPLQQQQVVGGDRVHIHILSAERYGSSLDGDEVVEAGETDLKSPFVNGLDDEPGSRIHDSLVSYHAGQEFGGFMDSRPRNTGMIPDSPPLTARPGGAQPNNEQSQQQQSAANGPLSTQLHTLLSQISLLESSTPTVMASEYSALEKRLSTLQASNATLLANREALFSLRDEDVSNLIKVRTLLAAERRAHEQIRKLRDEDLQNVIELRNKLAQATWANQSRSATPSSSPSVSLKRMEKAQSVSVVSLSGGTSNQSNDLWQTAKTAALEQKVLELESANADLRDKLDKNAKVQVVPQQSGAGMDDLKVENMKLKMQVEKMKYQLETSQAVIESFSRMLKSTF